MYDYLIVGAGLYGAVFAREATAAGKKVLIQKTWRESRFTFMVHTFFIPTTVKSGTM